MAYLVAADGQQIDVQFVDVNGDLADRWGRGVCVCVIGG
jgi:hypothetical protein